MVRLTLGDPEVFSQNVPAARSEQIIRISRQVYYMEIFQYHSLYTHLVLREFWRQSPWQVTSQGASILKVWQPP